MDYKISYNTVFALDGTVYRQTINASMGREEFRGLNRFIAVTKLDALPGSGAKLYLDTFKKGTNHATLSQSSHFARHFGLLSDKRYKTDRNTIIRINIV